MTRPATTLLLAGLLLPLSGPAFAQGTQTGAGLKPGEIQQPGPKQVTTPGQGQADFVKPGGGANSGPGSIETEVRGGGTGAASRSNNSGADGNAERPSQAIGNTGGGGGSAN